MKPFEGIIVYLVSAAVLVLVAIASAQSGNAMANQSVFRECAISGTADLGEGRTIICSVAGAKGAGKDGA